MKLANGVLVLLFTAALAGPLHAAPAAKLVAAKRSLSRAIEQGSPPEMIAARAAFERLAAAEPKSAVLHYWVALTDWRLVPRLTRDAELAQRYCKDGLDHIEQALKLDPKFGEALAVKSGLQGLWLRFAPDQMMTLGPQMIQNMARAVELAPRNPRVRLLDGINTLHQPEFVGGGAEPALAKLTRALDLFEAEAPADSTAPDWGRDDAHVWAGRGAMKLGRFEAARDHYRKALELSPESRWVHGTLLPEAEKAIAARATEQAKP
jgi:tetratricopeptide (TPR) repeat protein